MSQFRVVEFFRDIADVVPMALARLALDFHVIS